MYRIFTRDIIISVLLSIIAALLLKEAVIAICFPVPVLMIVLWVEEKEEKMIRVRRLKKTIQKLSKQKGSAAVKSNQSHSKNTVITAQRKRNNNEQIS